MEWDRQRRKERAGQVRGLWNIGVPTCLPYLSCVWNTLNGTLENGEYGEFGGIRESGKGSQRDVQVQDTGCTGSRWSKIGVELCWTIPYHTMFHSCYIYGCLGGNL